MEYWRKVFEEQTRQNAQERYNYLRLQGWPNDWVFLGEYPELDKIIDEILDDAVKYGVIDKLPERKKDLE